MEHKKKIAVFGGGSTGLTAAGYFGRQGFETALCDTEAYAPVMDAVREKGGVTLTGMETGFGPVATVTHDPAEALSGASLIFICVTANRHEEIARWIAPWLEDDQHILISPGNLGCFLFDRVFREMGITRDVTISVLEGNLFPCRLRENATVLVGLPFGKKRIAAYPSADTGRAIQAFRPAAEFLPARNAFDCAVNFTNFVVHIPSTVLSATAAEKTGYGFNIYESGITDGVLSCAEKLEEERETLAKAMGLEAMPGPLKLMQDIAEYEKHPYLECFHQLEGPDGIHHRYYTEDTLCNGAFLLSVADALGVDMPLLRSFVTVTSAMLCFDFRSHGRTLASLGFADQTFSEIMERI